jgi:hypothetical protein
LWKLRICRPSARSYFFPRTYEATYDLLVLGNLIVVKGKVDAPEGRPPKILADSVTNELTIYGAVGEAQAPYQTTPSPPPQPPVMPLFEQKPATDVAASPEPPPNFMPEATPQPEVPVLYEAGQTGHTNGKSVEHGSNGTNGHHPPAKDDTPSSQPEIAADTKPSQPSETSSATEQAADQSMTNWLHITMHRTGNLGQDQHRLRQIYNLLIATPGSDGFSIYIPNEKKKIRLDFPNTSTRYTAKLQQSLTLILGAKAVRVEQLD